MVTTKRTFCSLCESFCGLEVDVENNTIVDIRPDNDHVVSQGYACVKGIKFDSVQHSPDRITEPQKRVGNEWQSISWDQALTEIADKMAGLKRDHGRNRSATLWELPVVRTYWHPYSGVNFTKHWAQIACTVQAPATL